MEQQVPTRRTARPRTLGLIGVIVGVVGMGLAILPPVVLPEPKPEPLIGLVRRALSRQADPRVDAIARRQATLKVFLTASVSAGFVAAVLGIAAFLRKERRRFAIAAVGTGAVAATFQYLIVALGVVVLAGIVIAAVSDA